MFTLLNILNIVFINVFMIRNHWSSIF
jgi:hypothetical protein